jgi:hypothetical protein
MPALATDDRMIVLAARKDLELFLSGHPED